VHANQRHSAGIGIATHQAGRMPASNESILIVQSEKPAAGTQRRFRSHPVKSITGFLVAAWLMSGCVSIVPNDDNPEFAPDMRTGLCNDATPAPCNPPRD
jgi:hypothetical protein